VILKPAPENVQELYLGSIRAIGLDPRPARYPLCRGRLGKPDPGRRGLGWEVWCDGMEITQFTYFQQVGGIECDPVCAEITYGLERLAMYVQDVEFVYDLKFNEQFRYGEVFHQAEKEFSAYNFERADTEILFQHFKDAEKQCRALLEGKKLVLPAYDQCIKASHSFQSAGCARGDFGHRARRLYRPCPRPGPGLLPGMAGERHGRLYAEVWLICPICCLNCSAKKFPARMQAGAARDLERLMVAPLTDRGFLFEGIKAFAGPAAADLGDCGPAGQAEGCARGAERPQDRCAASRAWTDF
jgi:hypothetical protein